MGCALGLSARPRRTGRSRLGCAFEDFAERGRARTAGLLRPFLRQTTLQRIHQIDYLSRLALGRMLRQLAGEFFLDQLFQFGLIMVDEFPGLELPGSSRDDLLHDRELVPGGGLVGDRREELIGGADLLRKPQGVDEQTLAVWADRDDPLARVDYDLPDCGLAGVAQRIPDHAVPVFGETVVRDEVIGAVDVYR